MFTKYFADREHGGEEESRGAAVALRDEILERLKSEPARAVMAEFLSKYSESQKARARRRKRRKRRNAASPAFPSSHGGK